ncbi:MAG: hypothetical protein R3B89_04315 [Polyangiaceae bacterium]
MNSNQPSATRAASSRLGTIGFLTTCLLGVSLSACSAQVENTHLDSPHGNSRRALTIETTDTILGQRPRGTAPTPPDLRMPMPDAERLSREERATRTAAAHAALSRAGRIGSKSIGQSARWSSLNH